VFATQRIVALIIQSALSSFHRSGEKSESLDNLTILRNILDMVESPKESRTHLVVDISEDDYYKGSCDDNTSTTDSRSNTNNIDTNNNNSGDSSKFISKVYSDRENKDVPGVVSSLPILKLDYSFYKYVDRPRLRLVLDTEVIKKHLLVSFTVFRIIKKRLTDSLANKQR
jgi:hypothetical protein